MPIRAPGGDVVVPMYDNQQVNEDIRAIIGCFSGRPLTDLFAVLPYLMAYALGVCHASEEDSRKTMEGLSGEVLRVLGGSRIVGKSDQVM